jgi:hypothetical protein
MTHNNWLITTGRVRNVPGRPRHSKHGQNSSSETSARRNLRLVSAVGLKSRRAREVALGPEADLNERTATIQFAK